MDESSRRDDQYLLIDLVERILGENAVLPKDISIEEIQEWFAYKEEHKATDLVSHLVKDEDSSVEYSPGKEEHISIMDREEAEEYLESLRDTPWYEFALED